MHYTFNYDFSGLCLCKTTVHLTHTSSARNQVGYTCARCSACNPKFLLARCSTCPLSDLSGAQVLRLLNWGLKEGLWHLGQLSPLSVPPLITFQDSVCRVNLHFLRPDTIPPAPPLFLFVFCYSGPDPIVSQEVALAVLSWGCKESWTLCDTLRLALWGKYVSNTLVYQFATLGLQEVQTQQ